MSLKYHSFVILCLLIIPGIVMGISSDSLAAVMDVQLRDITPRSLLSHSAIDIALAESELITLGAGNRLVNVYDIRDVINPRRRGILELPAQGRGLAVDGKMAFIACPGYGLVVVDFSDPDEPRVTGEYKYILGKEPGVLVVGDYLYLHDGVDTLRAFLRVKPWELEEVGTQEGVLCSGELVHIDGHILLASIGITVVDVSDPANMKETSIPLQGSPIWALDAKGDLLCVADETDILTLYRIGAPGGFEEISSFNVGHVIRDVAINDNIIVAITADDLISFDITKPERMVLQGELPLICELRKVVPGGDYFFLASELDGPLVADVREAFHQRVIAYQAGLGLVSTIASRGSLMLAGSWDSIRALERREEGDMEIIGIQHSEGFTREMQITGDFAYLADPTRGLRVFNVSRPVFMRPVALLELPGTPSDVELVGDLAFIPLGDEGVAQVNIHYPFSPVLRMTIETDYPCTNVAKAGDYLYFLGPDGILEIYDITIPTQPRKAAWLKLTGIHPIDAQVYGEMMAVSGGTDGLLLLNVADPIRPIIRSKYVPGGSVETAALFDDGAILEVKGPGYCKIEIIDLRHIFAPYKRTELQLKERSDYRDKLHVVGDRAYLAAYNYGMKVIEMKGLFD